IAELQAGWELFLGFAVEADAVTAAEAEALEARVWTALGAAAAAQAAQQRDADPVDRFLGLLRSALGTGQAHVQSLAGGPPADARSWGWLRYDDGDLRVPHQ